MVDFMVVKAQDWLNFGPHTYINMLINMDGVDFQFE